MKESLLIQSMALDHEVSETEAPSPVRIVSPAEENPNNTDDEQNLDSNDLEIVEDQQLHIHKNPVDEESLSTKRLIGGDNAQGLREVSTYEDFMNHIDQQLKTIEDELETFLRFSSLILDNKEKPEYAKVEHVTGILAGVCHIRERYKHF